MKHRFSIWAATVTLATAGLAGCIVEETDVKNTDGGTAGAGGNSGGSGGSATAGTGGSATAGTGGTSTAGTGGTGGSTGGSGGSSTGGTGGTGAVCLGDEATSTDDCSELPYFATQCDDGGNTIAPLGVDLCNYSASNTRSEVHAEIYACLKGLTVDACSADHDNAVQDCIDSTFPLACDATATQPEGGTCADIVGSCPELTLSQCEAVYNAFTPAAQENIADCYSSGKGECAEDFVYCVYNF